MTRITPAEFFTRAIEQVPFRDPEDPKRYRHLGVRLTLLRNPYSIYYGLDSGIDRALDLLIKDKVVVAAQVIWGKRKNSIYNSSRTIWQVNRLREFPDPLVQEENPILYLPNAVPQVIKARLNQADDILAKILQPDP